MITKYNHSLLYVEDEEEIRSNYVNYLNRYFEKVYSSSDGESAYDIFLENNPEIIIVDINLPKMNGLELLEKIRETNHSIKAIILTAHADVDFLLKASELKLTKYLVKPITRNQLKESITLAINEIERFEIREKEIILLPENYIWNKITLELINNGRIVSLTKQETKILSLFLDNIDRVLSYDRIMLTVWDSYEFDKIDSIKTIVKNTRKKLPKDIISNIYGIGYKLTLKR